MPSFETSPPVSDADLIPAAHSVALARRSANSKVREVRELGAVDREVAERSPLVGPGVV